MTNITYSVNKVPIRLTEQRWMHIVENHDDMAGYYFDVLETVVHPDVIVAGYDEDGTLFRLRGKTVVGLTITNVSKKFK
jgi:hypothetical protein